MMKSRSVDQYAHVSALRPDPLQARSKLGLRTAGNSAALQSLRHTHASTLIASGVDILTVSRRLGHSSPTITLGVYGHLVSGTDHRAADIMEKALGCNSVADDAKKAGK